MQEASGQQAVHRGLVSNGIVQQPCSKAFLVVLCIEFCKAQSHNFITRLKGVEPEKQDRHVSFLAYEINRLFHYPRLFPNEASRVRFLAFLAPDSCLQMCQALCNLLMQKEIHAFQQYWQKNFSRESYVEGTKSWENFLLSKGPGLSSSFNQTIPKSMVQIMPPVGSRIVSDFEREETEILRFVQQNNPPLGQPAKMTALVDFDNPTEDPQKVPDSNLPQHLAPAMIQPNPYHKRRNLPLDLITSAKEDLEDYSSFIDCLETDPPNPNAPQLVLSNAHVLPALSVRTWKFPLQAKDIRYVQ